MGINEIFNSQFWFNKNLMMIHALCALEITMTTIGVRPFPGQRVLPLDFPSYNYHHPSIQAFTLGTTGEGVFRPMLPTHRRMEMDSVICLDEPNRPVAKCTRGKWYAGL